MPATLLLGKDPAAALLADCQARAARLAAPPTLAILHVGEDPAALAYVRSAVRSGARAGVAVRATALPPGAGFAGLLAAARAAAADPSVTAIQVQNPIPEGKSLIELMESLPPEKDAEGMHPCNQGLLFQGRGRFVPCTAQAVIRLLRHHGIPLRGRRALVLGRSLAVGRPAALLLLQEDATVTLCHTKTRDLGAEIARAEVVVAAAGVPELVRAEWFAPGAVVVDVGYHVLADGRIAGDVEAVARERVAAIAPVPGGVGPLTVAELLASVVGAACR
jgi:methylenetetrahydrofolate dehydrogenase (NADP+)/methenyltetrahydrofolate cyclohydrolase